MLHRALALPRCACDQSREVRHGSAHWGIVSVPERFWGLDQGAPPGLGHGSHGKLTGVPREASRRGAQG